MRNLAAVWLLGLLAGCGGNEAPGPGDLGTDLGFVDKSTAAELEIGDQATREIGVEILDVGGDEDGGGEGEVEDAGGDDAALGIDVGETDVWTPCPTVDCGGECCEEGQVCTWGGCCTPDCQDKLCGQGDGCGGDCGDGLPCDDGNPCTTDICLQGWDCVFQPVEGACDDGAPCTIESECQAGACVGTVLKDCSSVGFEGCPGLCEPESGDCLPTPLGDGVEVCDGVDNDCDGTTDEALQGTDIEIICGVNIGIGVCASNFLTVSCGFDPVTGVKEYICNFDALGPVYAKLEDGDPALCDGLDNDCDGLTDEGMIITTSAQVAAFSDCPTTGACKLGMIAMCNSDGITPGEWTCDDSQIPYHTQWMGYTWQSPEGLVEVECDGVDNDCDGQTDEGLDLDLGILAGNLNPKLKSGCPLKGYCGGSMMWSCKEVNGVPTWYCDPSMVPGWEEVEVSCDWVDNDCDGVTDLGLDDISEEGAGCNDIGVCSQPGVTASCVQGKYACWYDNVAGYDGPEEVTCDGLDNDCDGLVDEDLAWTDSAACSLDGVCTAEELSAFCTGEGGWLCLYDLIPEWESVETSCDGLDNDCDGDTDEGACDVCEPCAGDSDCASGACRKTLGGEWRCSLNAMSCLLDDPETGECQTVWDGAMTCETATQPCLCTALGTWYCNLPACGGNQPVCHAGTCRVCTPLRYTCDGNTVMQCTGSGDAWEEIGPCGEGYLCAGDGKCADASEAVVAEGVSALTQDVSPVVALRNGGGPVVVWQTDSLGGGHLNEIAARLYSTGISPQGSPFLVNSQTDHNQDHPAVASFPAGHEGFVVVWQSQGQDGDGWGIFGQRFGEGGDVLGEEFQVNPGAAGAQQLPRVATLGNGGFVVVWEGTDGEDPDGFGIYAQRFDSNGEPVGPQLLVNTTTTDDQRWPDVAKLDDEDFVVTWTSFGQDESASGVFFDLFGPSGAEWGQEQYATYYQAGIQKRGVAVGFDDDLSGQFMIAWESHGQDPGGGLGVFMLPYDQSGQKLDWADIQVNTAVTAGSQDDPAVAVFPDNSVVVVWETNNLDADGDAVAAKRVTVDGSLISDGEILVNESESGDQRNPDVATGAHGLYVVVWSSVGADGNSDIMLRPLK